jgi:predicted TIM-barrel fold metal-dependent hydrolase
MRKFDNIGFETSCLQMVDGIETLVRKVGAERVYMGTGMPLMYPYPCIYKIQKAQISDREKELILGENASNLLSGNMS